MVFRNLSRLWHVNYEREQRKPHVPYGDGDKQDLNFPN